MGVPGVVWAVVPLVARLPTLEARLPVPVLVLKPRLGLGQPPLGGEYVESGSLMLGFGRSAPLGLFLEAIAALRPGAGVPLVLLFLEPDLDLEPPLSPPLPLPLLSLSLSSSPPPTPQADRPVGEAG